MRRRTVLALGAASLAATRASAAGWPDHLVRVVVPYAPGGPVDLVTRLVSEKLGAKFGQSFVVENKPAPTVRSANHVGDGLVCLTATPCCCTAAPGAYDLPGGDGLQPAFDTLRDLTPISLVVYFDLILCANPALSVQDESRSSSPTPRPIPGKLSYGTAGAARHGHVGTEWFKGNGLHRHRPRALSRRRTGRGRPHRRACLGVAFVSSNVAIPLINAGKHRALAVPSQRRIAVLPDVPTMAESGFRDFDLTPWTALSSRPGSTRPSWSSLDEEREADPRRARPPSSAWRALRRTPSRASSPEQLTAVIEKSIALWKGVAAKAKIVVE